MEQRFGPGLLRLVLAAMVVFSHFTPIETGRVAVIGFFVLSGYWVTVTYVRNYAGSAKGVLLFYGARFFRIYPFYLIMLLLTLLVFRLTGDQRPVGATDFLLFGLARVPALQPVLRPAWSLDIELQFYLLLPLLVAMARGAGKDRRILVVGAAVAVTAAWWLWCEPRFGLNLLAYVAAFVIGMIAAIKPIHVPGRSAWVSAALFIAAGLLMAAIPALRGLLLKNSPNPIDRDIVAMLWGALLVPFILWNVRVKSIGRDRVYGELAFSLYLAHWMFAKRYPQIFPFLGHHAAMAAALVSIAIASYLAYALIDRPLEKVRKRLFDPGAHRARQAEDLTVP